MQYVPLSIPRPVYERIQKMAAARGFRSPTEALLTWAHHKLDELERANHAPPPQAVTVIVGDQEVKAPG